MEREERYERVSNMIDFLENMANQGLRRRAKITINIFVGVVEEYLVYPILFWGISTPVLLI